MNQFVVLSGCSGGGKSSVLAELARRGHAVVEEPGRRIVQQQIEQGGTALPWVDMAAFLRLAIQLSLADRQAMQSQSGWVFFDRGLVDAAAGLQRVTGETEISPLVHKHRYHARVFLTPPWPEIYVQDAERKHSFKNALEEYKHLSSVYPALGYTTITLPRTSISARADLVLATLAFPTS